MLSREIHLWFSDHLLFSSTLLQMVQQHDWHIVGTQMFCHTSAESGHCGESNYARNGFLKLGSFLFELSLLNFSISAI
jgi:hypothetical protein